MRRIALVLATPSLVACGPDLAVPADACRGGVVPELVGRNVGEVGFPPDLPHQVIIPGSEAQAPPPGTLLVRVDDKGWITAAGCTR